MQSDVKPTITRFILIDDHTFTIHIYTVYSPLYDRTTAGFEDTLIGLLTALSPLQRLDKRGDDLAALLLVEGDDLLAELRDIWLHGGQYPLLVR